MKFTTSLLLILIALPALLFADDWQPCTGHKGEYCKINLMQLHPTQMNVGLYQVHVDTIPYLIGDVTKCTDAASLKTCYDKSLKGYMAQKGRAIPVVYGYDKHYYLVDGHHRAYATWLLYHDAGLCKNNNCNIPFYVNIVHNYSNNGFNEQTFWQTMTEGNFFWPYTYSSSMKEYAPLDYTDLPQHVSDMGNDVYRSVFGLVAKWAKFQDPSKDQVNFYQFKWAGCMLEYFDFERAGDHPDYTQLIMNARMSLLENADAMVKICSNEQEFQNMPKPSVST